MPDDAHSPLDLNDTLQRMEPGVSVPGIEQSLASIAISLKRIADRCDLRAGEVYNAQHNICMRLDTIASAIQNHSSKVIMPR